MRSYGSSYELLEKTTNIWFINIESLILVLNKSQDESIIARK